MKKPTSLLLGLMLAGVSLAAAATDDTPIPRKFKPNQFAQVVDTIEAEMSPGGLYAEVKPEEQDAVRKALGRMSKALEGHKAIAELTEEEKVALINDQELVNALLLGNQKDQVVCYRREVPGTHIHQNVCETNRDAAMRREESRKTIRDMEVRNPAYSN